MINPFEGFIYWDVVMFMTVLMVGGMLIGIFILLMTLKIFGFRITKDSHNTGSGKQ